jgi:hypothetical protein
MTTECQTERGVEFPERRRCARKLARQRVLRRPARRRSPELAGSPLAGRVLTVVSWRVSRLSDRDELMVLLAKYAPRRSSWNLHRTFLVCNHTLKRRRTAPTPPVAIVRGRQPPLPLLSCNIFVPSDTITDVWRQSLVAELRL